MNKIILLGRLTKNPIIQNTTFKSKGEKNYNE